MPLTTRSTWLTVSLPGFQPAGQTKRNKNKKKAVKNSLIFLSNSWICFHMKEKNHIKHFQTIKHLDTVSLSANTKEFYSWSLLGGSLSILILPIILACSYNMKNKLVSIIKLEDLGIWWTKRSRWGILLSLHTWSIRLSGLYTAKLCATAKVCCLLTDFRKVLSQGLSYIFYTPKFSQIIHFWGTKYGWYMPTL